MSTWNGQWSLWIGVPGLIVAVAVMFFVVRSEKRRIDADERDASKE